MVKIHSYQFSDYRLQQAEQKLNSRTLLKRILTAIQEFFGVKEGSAFERIIEKKKFYGKNLQSYNYEETALGCLKYFFASREGKQDITIQKERQFKEKVFENLAFIKMEAASCRAALTSSKGKLAQVIDVKSESVLLKMLVRHEELKRSLDELSEEVQMFPEYIFGGKHAEYELLKSSIDQASSDLNTMRDACSIHFTNLVNVGMKEFLEELKTAESPEEKQAIKEQMKEIVQYVQSKAYFLVEADLNFINEIINVSEYLVSIAPKGGLLNFDDILTDVFTNSIKEISNGPVAELPQITDLEVFQRATALLDKRIDKLLLQLNFTSNLMDEETYFNFAESVNALKDKIDVELYAIIDEKKEDILLRMNAFNVIANIDTAASRDQYQALRQELEPEIAALRKFIDFSLLPTSAQLSAFMQTLSEDIEYKGWLIDNGKTTFMATNETDLVIGKEKYPTWSLDDLVDLAADIVQTGDPIQTARMDPTMYSHQKAFNDIEAKIAGLQGLSDVTQMADGLTEVEYALTSLQYELMQVVALNDLNGKESSAALLDLINDVEQLSIILKIEMLSSTEPQYVVKPALKDLDDVMPKNVERNLIKNHEDLMKMLDSIIPDLDQGFQDPL